jgi:arylsulfatase A-like enzyme
VRAEIPDALRGAPTLLEPFVEGEPRGVWLAGTPLFVETTERTVSLSITRPPEATSSGVRIAARRLPFPERRFSTGPLALGPNGELRVGLGFDPATRWLDAVPVEFAVTAHDGAAEHLLLRTTLDSRGIPDAWLDQHVDLAPLSGRTVRFTFTSRIPTGEGAARVAAPLWGAPRIIEERKNSHQPNIILVSLDTLRGDHVGARIADRPLTPEIDTVARAGATFVNAFTTYPSTSGSHMSLLTGLYFRGHGVASPVQELAAGVATLPERLASHGYATEAFTEAGMLTPASGFARGFDGYRAYRGTSVRDTPGRAATTFAAALRWVQEHRREKFFLLLHTYQVHAPYTPPSEFALPDHADPVLEPARPGAPPQRVPPAQLAYAGEIRYLDHLLGDVFRELDRLHLSASTIVVLTSDHGEEFGEHGGDEHGATVYDEVLRVPLIFWGGSVIPAGVRVEMPTSLVDVTPTLLDLLGLGVPAGLHGMSLAGVLRGERTIDNRTVFAELTPGGRGMDHLVAARSRSHKWIVHGAGHIAHEIFDLHADPTERHPVRDQALVDEGARTIAGYWRLGAPPTPRHASANGQTVSELAPETTRELRALGYLE